MNGLEAAPEERLRRLYADLAGYAEGFCRTARDHGAVAARSFLGAYVEWLGVDLADATVLLPPELWSELDVRADRLLDACRAYLVRGDPGLLPAVEAIGAGAWRCLVNSPRITSHSRIPSSGHPWTVLHRNTSE